MGLKDVFLNKGWAGTTLSRTDTVDRLNPVIKQFRTLNLSYDAVISACRSDDVRQKLQAFQKKARVEVGKLSESVLSCGGIAYSGTELEPDDFVVEGDDGAILEHLRNLERDFKEFVQTESKETHQMRTRAILQIVLTSSQERLNYLQNVKRR